MQEPNIIYEQVMLSDKNVRDFLDTQLSGQYISESNSIIVYKYCIGKGLSKRYKPMVSKLIRQMKHEIPITIAHERRHWYNENLVGDLDDLVGQNYYQEMVVYYTDEISARGASLLYCEPELVLDGVCPKSIARAMLAAAGEFAYPTVFDDYLHDFTRVISDELDEDLSDGTISVRDLNKLQKIYRNNRMVLFTPKFNHVMREMFTFDGICLPTMKKMPRDVREIWSSAQEIMGAIRAESLRQTASVIDGAIIKHR